MIGGEAYRTGMPCLERLFFVRLRDRERGARNLRCEEEKRARERCDMHVYTRNVADVLCAG